MTADILDELAQLIERDSQKLLEAWRAQVKQLPSAKTLDTPTLTDHIPYFIAELATALRAGSNETAAEAVLGNTPPAHGVQRVADTFDIEEVVAEYNILRACLIDLAEHNGLNLQGNPLHLLNRVLDGAIAAAVRAFAAQQALEVQHRREEYLSFVAHDLRTPLNAISLSARVLEMLVARQGAAAPEAAQMLKALKRNVQYLQSMVAKVLEENTNLETEAGVRLERRVFDLWPLVEALIHDLHPAAGTGTTRLTNAVPEDFVLFADAGLLRRVFQNLIANAIASTPRGEVIVGARKTPEAGTVECFVRDNGEGMSEERCQTVWTTPLRDEEKPGGLGLGLTIVKTFVEAHDGVVTVKSELGVGSTFRFTLPSQPD